MSNFNDARLLYLRASVEALVSEREAMILANEQRRAARLVLAYSVEDFQKNAEAIRACAPNPHEFAS